jgi:hypothetical protein
MISHRKERKGEGRKEKGESEEEGRTERSIWLYRWMSFETVRRSCLRERMRRRSLARVFNPKAINED